MVDENAAVAVRTDLPVKQLALIGCGVITGMGAALNTAKVQPGSTVAVVGLGGIGQSIIQGAKVAGASTIVAIDPLANKRDMAARLGATHTVNPADGDVGEQVRSLTNGRGADYSFEAVGLESAINGVFSTKLGPGCRSRRAILKTSTDWLLPTHRSSWPISCNHRWRPPALCGAGSADGRGARPPPPVVVLGVGCRLAGVPWPVELPQDAVGEGLSLYGLPARMALGL